MRCPCCREENREARRFCAHCGRALPVPCPDCGFPNLPDENFCGGCGAELAARVAETLWAAEDPAPAYAAPAAEPEHRQVTVIFCDLVGSTELSRRTDPEDLREIIRSYQRACATAIERYEGYIGRYLGDGILAYFGYPQAHEDDAERAVRAGLDIVEAIGALDGRVIRELRLKPAVRIGIATGRVLAGDLIGSGPSQERAVVGETPNLAARMQTLAEPNSVAVAPGTRALLGDLFQCEDLGAQPLKGFAESVHAWRVLRPKYAWTRFEVVRAHGLTPLVGRQRVLEKLLGRWERAKRGDGGVMLLSGEAGVGKSRITETFLERVAEDHPIRFRYQGSPYHTNTALYPFIHHLERAARFEPDDSASTRLGKLEALLNEPSDRLPRIAPLFAALLSIPTSGRYSPLELAPQQLRARIFAAMIEQVERYATNHLVLLVFEDAHWSDPTSRELIERVVAKTRGARVMVVMTHRTNQFTPSWKDQPHVTTVELHPLSPRLAAAMVARIIGDATLPAEVIEQIVARADGVPLFVEELTRTVLASDRSAAQGWQAPDATFNRAIPSSLQDSLMARLDRLAGSKEIAQICAVIGREFSYEELAAVCRRSEPELRDALATLTHSGLVQRTRRGTRGQTHYVFKHVLLQEAAYESLLKARRQELHARIADALEAHFPERARAEPELLARHLTRARLPARAVQYWTRAARQALARSANSEAIAHANRGLEPVAELPEAGERHALELELHVLRGAAYRAHKSFGSEEVIRDFSAARELCERTNDTVQALDVYRGLHACHYVRGDWQEAGRLGREMMRLAERYEDRRYLCLGHYMLGSMMFWQGDFRGARVALEESAALYDSRVHSAMTLATQLDLRATVLNHLAWTLWMLGSPQQALQTTDRVLDAARRLGHPFNLALALFWTCVVRSCCGLLTLEDRHFLELKSINDEYGFGYLSACAHVLEAQLLVTTGHADAARALLRRSFATFETEHAGLGRPWACAVWVSACQALGAVEEAREALGNAFRALEAHGERHWEAELYRLEGELLSLGAGAERIRVQRAFQRALEVARAQGARSLELRAAISQARWAQHHGDGAGAAKTLDVLYRTFTEGLDTADLRAAKDLLATSG
jgi:class 3 adenylate cyclase/tetratricopeptide (TPR) repeat protein